MANKTNTGTNHGELSNVPPIRSFEFDKTAIGNIKSSVNKFRGCVSLPLDFLSLPGLEGLDVKLSALYSSNIKGALNSWNLEAPTGILGLGWQMPLEMIVADKAGSASATSDTYYMMSGGAANPMVKTGETADGKWVFQLRNFQFWSVQYDAVKKNWIIIKENGFVYTYGAEPGSRSNATQWGISCGNWIGATSVGATQVQFPSAWNLASIETPLGNKLQYQYLNVNQKLISSGLEYTQASYLEKVIDSYGRVITFNYEKKFGLFNPDTHIGRKPIIEYQPQHTPTSPNAYQDHYETYFLDAIEVADLVGETITGFKFTYTFINNAPESDSGYSYRYKRCLQSVFQYAATGETLPAIQFEYFPSNASHVNPGALKSITYPEGGVAQFEYKEQTITSVNSSKKSRIANPLSGSIPRVWFGFDFVVFTYLSERAGKIQVKIQSWNGQWVNHDFVIGKNAVPDSLVVQTSQNFISLSFRNKNTGNDELYLLRNDDRGQDLQFGKWVLYNDQPFILALKAQSTSNSIFVAGDNFVIAYNKDYTAASVQGFSYSWQDGRWNTTAIPVPPNADCQSASITAYQNFYIVSCYLQNIKQLKNYIFYRTADGGWKQSNSVWTLSNIEVVLDPQSGAPYLALSALPASVVFTYVTQSTNSAINYSLRVFNWDENFFVLNASSPSAVDASSPIIDGKSLYQIFRTIVVGSTVNNNLSTLRNKGGDQKLNAAWVQKQFQHPGQGVALNVAVGEDVSLLSAVTGSSPNQLASYNPGNPPNGGAWTLLNGQAGNNPSISGSYMTVGKNIYYRNANGEWKQLATQLNNFNDPSSCHNRGPRFISYQDASDATASTYIVALKNGEAQLPQKLNNVKTFVPDGVPGTMLVADRFLVTYPSSASSFNDSSAMDLWNLDEVNFGDTVKDTPVANLVIEDKYDPTQSYTQSYYYANSPESQIVYNALMNVAQYPLVTVVPAIKNNAIAPPTRSPQGYSQFFFSNGLAKQSTLYPTGGIQNYQNVLNGIQLGQKDYDAEGNLVSSQLDYWTVYSKGLLGNLYGGYARCEKTASKKDGLLQWSRAGYDRETGVLLWQEKSYYNSKGIQKNLRTENLYAFQVAEYASIFKKQHNYTSVAMVSQSVLSADGNTKVYTQSEATTYRNWDNLAMVSIGALADGSCRLAAYETFDWITPGNTAPQFPASGLPNENWQLKTQIISRSSKSLLITEQVDINGLTSSFFYDVDQKFLVAKFPNGSISGDEVSYYGFEKYENSEGWQLGSGTSFVPNIQSPTIDAHTGISSLSIAAGTAGSKGICRTFYPHRKNQRYVFSAWVKKPVGFVNELGNASWKIVVNGQPLSSSLSFPAIIGQWAYVFQIITMPANSNDVKIDVSCENLNSSCNVLVDNLRFTPLTSMVEAYSYKKTLEPPNAVLGSNGETVRKIYNTFQQEIITTNQADHTSKVQLEYLSRKGNQGTYAIPDPNHSISLNATNGGKVTEFTRGSEWESLWKSQTGVWKVKDTCLTQKEAGLVGTLECGDESLSATYALDVDFKVLETITTPLGIQLGSKAIIQWNPKTTSWQLLRPDSVEELLPQVDARAFTLPLSPFDTELNDGVISANLCLAFANNGYLLPAKSEVGKVEAESQCWVLTSTDNKYRYALRVDGSQIAVYKMDNRWTLFVDDSKLVFWADGKLIFSYTTTDTEWAKAKLFFGNLVCISQITLAANPMSSVTFTDSRGIDIQIQKYAGSKMIVEQSITDNMGRIAVGTKPAYVNANQNSPFTYCEDFAKMNWEIGTIAGLVSNAFPNDKGYPFSRQVFENSPLSRLIKQSVPGELFQVNGENCTRFSYSTVKSNAGEVVFSKRTTTNPNGDTFYTVSTQLDQEIQNVSEAAVELKNENDFDDFGNPTIIRSPNYFNPPKGSTPQDWVTTQTFDYQNRLLTLQQGAKIVSKFIYDKVGNVRFSQDAQGAQAGTFNYVKYDMLSRSVETGYVTGVWDSIQLQQYADNNPTWPIDTFTWRVKNSYDEAGAAVNTIGRITKMEANNGNKGIADVIENLGYDILGNTISDLLKVNAFDGEKEYLVQYRYNELGIIVKIDYPVATAAYSIFYKLNSLNQITSIIEKTSPKIGAPIERIIANYSYDATGHPFENILMLENNGFVRQSYTFNAPQWLMNIDNRHSEGSNLFKEELTYTEGGFSNKGYYDGLIASSTVQVGSLIDKPNPSRYSYDTIGQMLNANKQEEQQPNPNQEPQFQYDPNGNILNFTFGALPCSYTYNPGSQQVHEVIDASGTNTLASFSYDDNGNVLHYTNKGIEATNSYDLSIAYDPATMLPSSIKNSASNGSRIVLGYGCRNERILKEVTDDAGSSKKKLYIRGTSSMPLQELCIGSATSVVNYIYGPGGLIAMNRLDGQESGFFHVLKDHTGSVHGVLNLQGAVVASYQYQTFGALAKKEEPISEFMPYLFTGQEYDVEIGLYNYRARFYCAEIGRFIAIDPGRQYFSPYLYASNNPVLFVDPTGMFSIGSFFSAIGGMLLGAIEVLIGVVIDVVAGAIAVLTGGLATPVAIGIGALSGFFYGAGINSITYSVFHFDDFSWKDYGIQMGIGAATGIFTGGLGAGMSIAAKSAQVAFTELAAGARLSATAFENVAEASVANTVKAGALKVGGWASEKAATLAGLATDGPVTAGWTGLAKGIGIGVAKSEAIGISWNTISNLATGKNWDDGLGQVVFKSALSGSISGFQMKNRIQFGTE